MTPDQFKGGPGYFTHDGVLYQLLDDNFEANSEIVTAPISTNLQGRVDMREEYVKSVVSAQPIAFKSTLATLYAKLVPYRPSSRGNLLRGSTDKPLVIQSKAGKSTTFTTACLTKQANLQFAPNKPLFGPVEFTCLRKASGADTATDSHVAVATSAYSEPALDAADILSCLYTYALGASSPLDALEFDEAGVTLETTVQLQDLGTAYKGLLNYRVGNVEAQLRGMPQNLDESDIYNTLMLMDGSSAGRGKSLKDRALPFVITGAAEGDPLVTIPLAVCVRGKAVFGTASRAGEIVLAALLDTDTPAELFDLDVVPAP